jgi:2-polyprenyl-3-methyl-5-hydroxy-6-metoxy-1,4-benzoquinol methylase
MVQPYKELATYNPVSVIQPEIKSPIATDSPVKLNRVINAHKLIKAWQQRFQIDITDELHHHQEIYLYKCIQTGLNFFVPNDVAGADSFYKQLEKFDWYYMPRKWEHDVAIQDLTGAKQIMEVGCGRGDFVQRLRSLNLDAQGIEINSNAVEYANMKGIPLLPLSLHELAYKKPEYYDAVCAFQVLEHIAQPRPFLSAMIELIKPGGKLIITVPNSRSFTKYVPDDLLNQPPHHMTQWCKRAIKSLTTIYPIQVKRFRFEPLADYHINWYLKAQVSRCPQFPSIQSITSSLFYHILKPILTNYSFLRRLITGHTLYVYFQKAH